MRDHRIAWSRMGAFFHCPRARLPGGRGRSTLDAANSSQGRILHAGDGTAPGKMTPEVARCAVEEPIAGRWAERMNQVDFIT